METPRPLKIYFLPFFAQGHQIPLVQLARLVASRGQHVTIVTTPGNAELFQKTIDDDIASGHHIRVHLIKFPNTRVGLPEGVENLVSATTSTTAAKIHMAAHFIQPQIEAVLKESPPDVFIPDILFTWSKNLSKTLQIPRLVFNPISIFDVCMIQAIKTHPEAFLSDSAPYHIPGLPHPLTLPVKPSPGFAALTESLLEGEEDSHGVIVNSFAELDAEYTQHYENLTGRKVWHVGPSSLMVEQIVKKPAIVSEIRHECLTWLDSKERDSVLYVCFGSLVLLSDKQLYELATGLDASGHSFIWVVHRKNKEGEEEEEEKWLPEGFEEKIEKEKRGMLIKGWAPQPLILNHPAVGGFLTHCGWNAVAEAISAGIPMVTMPGFSDQYYNEKLITEVHGFGVEVGAAEWSISPYDGKKEVLRGERIEKAVKRLMDRGEEGGKIRKKAKEMQEKAWRAVQEGGSSHNSLTALVDYLKALIPNRVTAT
ncbi:UDP-glucose flavonoid 3-O-glucosyltransferase 7-like [Vigna unguiculata]|uniref:Glycosyltransferase n=1 Tax=Vigna unguiculata TaxID=3917 RepID=A0A4D6MMV4_VIGUN|nr:UDP-glucose flavonoid 3-O-glucosyltransferase 7-like [Vigna unguiculata]QCE02703.1 UDP-glucosyl transferase 73C [Vigna unguiculata]